MPVGPPLRYDEDSLAARLAQLAAWQKAAFALACAQRMLPVYLKYCASTGKGDPEFAIQTANTTWHAIESNGRPTELMSIRTRAEDLIPPGDAVGEIIWHYWAANALAALIYALGCADRDALQEAVWAARQPIDVIGAYVEERYRLRWDSRDERLGIENSRELQAELSRQSSDIELLMGQGSQSTRVRRVRDLAAEAVLFDYDFESFA